MLVVAGTPRSNKGAHQRPNVAPVRARRTSAVTIAQMFANGRPFVGMPAVTKRIGLDASARTAAVLKAGDGGTMARKNFAAKRHDGSSGVTWSMSTPPSRLGPVELAPVHNQPRARRPR